MTANSFCAQSLLDTLGDTRFEGGSKIPGVDICLLSHGGALVDYSFSEGHLVYQAGATAVQNTLLLHESTDSISFVFEAATHTKGVTLKVEHPQLDGDDLQEVRLFPREDAEEDSGEEHLFQETQDS